MLEEAKRLIKLGLPIIPICPHDHANMSPMHIQRCKCPGKTPLIKGWQNKSETTEEELMQWVAQFKTFNIGLPLGEASGFCGIDVDGEKGEEFLLELSGGDLPETWEFTTGSGRRLLYLIPFGIKTKKFSQNAKEGGHQECAILCTGQQTVLPPSIHHTGKTYQWVEGRSPWDLDCAEAPKWLINLIKVDEEPAPKVFYQYEVKPKDILDRIEEEFVEAEFKDDIPTEYLNNSAIVKAQKGKTGHTIKVTEELLTREIPEGQRDVTMTAIVGHYCANRELRMLGKDVIFNICWQHNLKYCKPPLDEQAIWDKVNYFFEAEKMKDAKYQTSKNAKPQFEASKMAALVKEELENQGILLHFDQHSKMYYYTTYEKGPWICTKNTTLINKWIRDIITNPNIGHPSWDKQSYVDETRKALEELFTKAFKDSNDFDIGAHADELSKYIVVNNGMLDWRNGVLLPWDPSYKTTISFDVDYDPDADCPRWKQYMSEWLPDPQVRAVVQEFVGYCLIPNTKFRKALFLYGKGKNGKSMFLEFLQEFFGPHKATLSYDMLFQRFGPANLKDKLVNIFDDTTVSFVKDTGLIKNLIAGGTISAEFKGRDHFTFTNVARFIFSAQETPKTADHSEAWYDRWIFVKFPNKFRPSNEKKREMQQAMREEKSGIFNWMLEGLRRLMFQDGFSYSHELTITSQEYRAQNDSVAMFVHRMCKVDPLSNTGTPLNMLYKAYCVWAEFDGLRPLSKRSFAERLLDLGFEKKKGYVDGKSGQTYFQGLFIDKESEDFQENKLEYTLALQNM